MRSPFETFAAWANRTDLTGRDLARYRVIFGVVGLLNLWNYHWPALYPDSVFSPPPGPFMLFDGFLPLWVSLTLELALAVAFAFLVFGVRVVGASVAVTVLSIALAGFTYSLGKADHTILLEVTPVVLAAAGWGRPEGPVVRGWMLRLLAFIIGLAILSAALMKIATGWLEPHTHAVMGFAFESHYQQQNTTPISGVFVSIESGVFWELLDWTTVLMEAGIVLMAFASWRVFRCSLAVLALFHVGVLLTLNIGFSSSILIYGAFLPWSRLPVVIGRVRASVPSSVAAVVVGFISWAATLAFGNLVWLTDPVLVAAGGLVGVWYLARTVFLPPAWQRTDTEVALR